MSESSSSSSGIGLGMILFLIFMTLKLTDNVDWSWWWVTSPLWIPTIVAVLIVLVIRLFDGLSDLLS